MGTVILALVGVFILLVVIGMCSDYLKERDIYRERWLNAQDELIRVLTEIAKDKGTYHSEEENA